MGRRTRTVPGWPGRGDASTETPPGSGNGQRFQTQAEAETWGADREAEVASRAQANPKQPFGPYARRWLASRVVETTTEATDRGRMTKHILPAWRSAPLDGIRASAVQSWVKQLTTSGLAAATVRSCHHLLAGVLEAAVRDRLIGCNPARGVQLPATPPGREVYLGRAEVDQVPRQCRRGRPGGAVDPRLLRLALE